MLNIIALGAALIIGGKVAGLPGKVVNLVLGIILGAVLLVQLTLPENSPLRQATGGSLRNWLILVGIAGLFLGYRETLRILRARHLGVQPEDQSSDKFKPEELDRYARHIIMREIGGTGQRALKDAKVLVIGAGGLGAPALQYLAAMGVGTIGVVDDDVVENSNLQRQVIHTDGRIGQPKVFSAEHAMTAQNPFIKVRPYNRRLTEDIAAEMFGDYDLVLDGCDNFDTRYLVNRTCAALGLPLISAAITQWEGQIGLYHPAKGLPCYRCVFPAAPAPELAPSCAEAGVIGALPGVIGSMMAVEAVKVICGIGEPLAGRLMIYDALYAETRVIAVKPRSDCPICGVEA